MEKTTDNGSEATWSMFYQLPSAKPKKKTDDDARQHTIAKEKKKTTSLTTASNKQKRGDRVSPKHQKKTKQLF